MGPKITEYKKGEVIFVEGSVDEAIYEIAYGEVGIVRNYNRASEVELGSVREGYFGENGLGEGVRRNATAVANEDTGVIRLDAAAMKDYFAEYPVKLDILLQDVSARIRSTDKKYLQACEYIARYMAAEEEGASQDPQLIADMKALVQ